MTLYVFSKLTIFNFKNATHFNNYILLINVQITLINYFKVFVRLYFIMLFHNFKYLNYLNLNRWARNYFSGVISCRFDVLYYIYLTFLILFLNPYILMVFILFFRWLFHYENLPNHYLILMFLFFKHFTLIKG